MRKLILGVLAVALTAGGVTAVSAAVGGDSAATNPASAPSAVDISGPCDEAEHANDPRCAGGAAAADDGRGRDHPEDDGVGEDDATGTAPVSGVDVSGPCDEAEHAGDPRCTGAATVVGDDDDFGEAEDNSGPGSVNSGPGSVNSGPGSVDDDSGSGHSGGDDSGGNSGPGGGGDDD